MERTLGAQPKKAEPKTIRKMYWITHPAFSVASRFTSQRRTPAEVRKFIEKTLRPLVKKAQGEPDAVVVLVKSPIRTPLSEFLGRRQDTMNAIEGELEALATRVMKNRAITVAITGRKNEHPNQQLVAEEVRRQLRKKNLSLSRDADVEAYGSYWESCAWGYPQWFRLEQNIGGRFNAPETGSVSREKKPAKRKTNEECAKLLKGIKENERDLD